MRKASVLFVAIALALFGLAACGGDDDDDGGEATATEATDTEATETEAAGGGGASGPGGTLALSAPADGGLDYDKDSAQAKPGTLTINFDNPASLSHDVRIEDESGEELGGTDLIAEATTSATVDLQAGTYTFFCSVPGHREGGMEGTLTVK